MMLAMHEGLDTQQLADAFGLSERRLRAEVGPLIESSLVRERDGALVPAVLVVDADEAQRVYQHSKELGAMLAEALKEEWDTLENGFSKLSISQSTSLKEQGFMLVGSRILDIGVLDVLAKDRSLLLPAPSRPSPTRPDARYYFWAVEGDPAHLGRYGQDDTTLRWPGWHMLNFGQTIIDGEINEERRDFEDQIETIVASSSVTGPKEVAEFLGVYFLNQEESEFWHEVSEEVSVSLFNILKENQSNTEEFYRTLKASNHSDDSFGEFYCWYYHLVYVWAIDALAERGMIEIPPERCSGIVLYREGPEALLVS
jgi:hypothetical protein